MKKILPIVLILLAGCSTWPLRPGKSNFSIGPNGPAGNLKQSQNPQQPSTQVYEKMTEIPMIPPPVTPPLAQPIIIPATKDSPAYVITAPQPVAQPSAPIIVRTTERMSTQLGAAQKDVSRGIASKLASLSILVWVGLALFVFGVGSFVYPPLKIIVGGSTTTSAAITGAGIFLMILPVLVVGHEILILAVGLGAVGLYWFAHQHGNLKGSLNTLLTHVIKTPEPPK